MTSAAHLQLAPRLFPVAAMKFPIKLAETRHLSSIRQLTLD